MKCNITIKMRLQLQLARTQKDKGPLLSSSCTIPYSSLQKKDDNYKTMGLQVELPALTGGRWSQLFSRL